MCAISYRVHRLTGPLTQAHVVAQDNSLYTPRHEYAMFAANMTAIVVPRCVKRLIVTQGILYT